MSKARTNAEELRTSVLDSDIGTTVLAPNGNGSNLTGIDSLPSQSSQSGKFLTTNGSAASWGTVAGAGMVLLSTVTASNSSTVDIETTFDSTYASYMLIASNLRSSSDGGILRGRMKIGGSYITTETYNFHMNRSSSGSHNYLGTGTYNTPSIMLNDGIGNASTHSASFTMSIDDPANTTLYKKIHWEGSRVVAGGAKHAGFTSGTAHSVSSANALTGLRFYIESANIVSGIFRLYGIAK